jgi:threonine dehydrogenase-like Zn-dependent dehydrogenase
MRVYRSWLAEALLGVFCVVRASLVYIWFCADMLNERITAVRKGGRISIVGVYVGFVNHLNIGERSWW